METEFENPVLLERLMTRKPHFAERAFAKFLFQNPLGVRHNLIERWPPAKYLISIRRYLAMRFVRISWRKCRRVPHFTDFTNLKRFFDSLHHIMSVIEPCE